MNQDIEHFIERAGLVFEAEGMPRMAGRILGYLMVSSPAEQSIAGLMSALAASNGSISTMTRFLEGQGYLRRVVVRGDRKDYFVLRSGVAESILDASRRSFTRLAALFEEGLVIAGDDRPALAEARDLFSFIGERYPALIEEWRASR